ncbi:MAG: MmcQ/YjbR family DNA-binding protein [Micromonosporaceae bacterium]
MVTAADIRAVALSLPRAYEALVRDQVKFRVGRIVFVTISPDETTMGFGFPKAERAALVAAEPAKFFMPTRSDERYHWVQARLAALDQTEMRELVTDAWCMCVPKSVAAAYFATTPATAVTPPNPPAARRSPRRPDPR